MSEKATLIKELDLIRQAIERESTGEGCEDACTVAQAIDWIDSHADGWAYARKMDKLRQEAETEHAAQPEPTEAQVERLAAHFWEKQYHEKHGGWDDTDISDRLRRWYRDDARAALTAALRGE